MNKFIGAQLQTMNRFSSIPGRSISPQFALLMEDAMCGNALFRNVSVATSSNLQNITPQYTSFVNNQIWKIEPYHMHANVSVIPFQRDHPSAPKLIAWVDTLEDNVHMHLEDACDPILSFDVLELMNRNARHGKRANRGNRPVSRQRRRVKKRAFGNHRR